MAVSATVLWSSINIFILFLSLSVVTTNENVTSHTFNTTSFGHHNVTYNVTDSYTTTQPTEFGATKPTPSYSSTEEPVQPTPPSKPLPVSGCLLVSATNVDRLCPCDEHKGVCDINCCCDRDCSEEVALFTGCSVRTVSGNKKLCSCDVASYSLGSTIDGFSELQFSVRKETNYDIFCIQSQNRIDGLSQPSSALPTDTNFDWLFKQFTSFVFGLEEDSGQMSTAEVQASSGYQYGDEMVTAGASGERGIFWLPASGITADCLDKSPAAFLKDQSRACSRRVVLGHDCSSLLAFNMDTYTNIQLFAGKNKDAAVVPVAVATVILNSVDGTQTELNISGGENLSPVLLNPDLCANVVLKVVYVMKYNRAGEIVNVTVSLVLGFVHEAALPLKQEFHITFVQQDGEEVALHYSGNPGYVVGLPLVSGTRTADGIVSSINLRDRLSLLHSTEDQDCLQGPHQRSPVLFGLDSVSGCKLILEDAANCSLVSQVLLDVLRGPNYPQYVASFGNSRLNNPLDWVQIKNNFSPGEAQSCSIPLSLHLEIEWTKYGSLVNPQPEIVSIKEVIQTNTTSLALSSGGSSILSIRISAAFIPVSAAALPGYRATPTINAKLPFDFFFPFV
ncbi:tectonic-1 isoform X3 [Xiphias gladius]|uniref:tectonic-1 isoform X3 n=1 Tax=Xiphias gladius TaxID=8245 RepID=UPI001A98D35D|nr:tectonic-1 isoform X3 [Xiphias gladius]